MNTLRMRKLRVIRKYIIIFSIAAVFFALFCILPYGAKSYKTWSELDFASDLSFTFVTNMDVDIAGPYYTNKDEDNQYELYYIIIDDKHIMPISCLELDILELAHEYLEAKEKYKNGDISYDEFREHKFVGVGRLERVSNWDKIPELEEYLSQNDNSDMKQAEIIPYSMQVVTEGSPIIYLLFMGGFFIVSIGAVLVCLVRAMTSCGNQMIKKYRKEQGDSLILRNKISQFFKTQEIAPSLWLNQDYIAGLYNTTTIFAETKQIIWAYAANREFFTGDAVSTVTLAFTQPKAALKIYLSDGKVYDLQLKNLEDVDKGLEFLREHCSWIITEYSQELLVKYRRKEYPF